MERNEAGRTVAIAGGGIVGRTLAVALAAQSHLAVRLFAGPLPPADARASAVAASGRTMLDELGVWPLVAGEAQPIREMVITDSDAADAIRPEVLSFSGPGGGREEDAFAHMIPNEALRRALGTRCGALGVTESALSVTYYEEDGAGVLISPSEGADERAAVLVAADGRGSRLREIAGLATVRRRYGQAAIVGTLTHEEPHRGRATQHFLPNGPLAMLPLKGERSSLVWTERAEFANAVVSDNDLAALEIERAFGHSLGRIAVEGALQVHPIEAMLARGFVAGRLALLGDAAHVIHPLAGQGLNLGLRDAAALAEVLIEADRNGEDLSLALPRYERWRRADTLTMTLVTDGLNALFSRRSDALRALRSVGLAFVERQDAMKGRFMREAAGRAGELPRLMRGVPI